MSSIARLLKYLFWLLVVSSSVALLQRMVGKMSGGEPKPSADMPGDTVNQKLVRDPVCGMHVAEGLALPLKQGEKILHFCSDECRRKFLNGTLKLSASA
jgi:YHS domain-containing protein